jgi:exoribonuclease-2
VDIELETPTPASQLLVSELMILANAGAAIWAAQQSVPMLYRSQEVSAPAGLSGVWERPEDIQRVVRQMGCTSLETRPAPHASLAVPAYSPISSPLRRYPDLLNLAQIHSFLATGAARLDRAGLERLLPGLTARLDAAGQIQRFRPRYWKLVYFRQRQKTQTWQGVIVEENGPFLSVAIPLVQIYVRAPRELFGERGHVGSTFQVKLGKVDPLTNEIRIAEAWEE